MRISAVTAQVSADLAALGALGDETMAESARRLAAAMSGPLNARIVEVLTQAAAELDVTIGDAHVEVRLVGDEISLVILDRPDDPVDPPAPDAGGSDTDARISLRLPTSLKARIDAAAAAEGISVNTYVVRTLSQPTSNQTTRGTNRPGRNRLSGWGVS